MGGRLTLDECREFVELIPFRYSFDESKHPRDQRGRFKVADKTDEFFFPPNGKRPGVVWRVQPSGAVLHHQKSMSTEEGEIEGVFVFSDLNDLAPIDWSNEHNVELVAIKVDSESDLFDAGDQEGEGLRNGRGLIIARKSFEDIRAVRKWAQDNQETWREKGKQVGR